MKTVTILLTVLLGSSLSFAGDPCEKVKSVLSKSEYFKNVDNKQNLLGYVMFQSTPIAQVMYYSRNEISTVVAKNDPGTIVGPVHIESKGNKCIFITEIPGMQAKVMGHDIQSSEPDAVQFVIDPNDKDVFFPSSKMIAITEKNELGRVLI